MKYTGEHLNEEFCRAVGINPESVYRIIVDLNVGEVARVYTEGFVETDDGKIDRLKRILRYYELKPKGGIKLKNPFKRNKPEPEPEAKARDPERSIPEPAPFAFFRIPKSVLSRGVTLRFTEDDVEEIPTAGPLYTRLGMKLDFHFDPSFFRDSKQYWHIEVTPDYTYRGQCFGVADVAKLAQDVGLVFPNEASSASDVRVLDDGRVAWCVSYLPDATEVVKFAEEVQRQITGIMADYGRTKAIMGAVKRGSK
jgi:hypothetical protein